MLLKKILPFLVIFDFTSLKKVGFCFQFFNKLKAFLQNEDE